MNNGQTLIIAEMAWAHDGSIDKAIDIMKAAHEAGADAIGIHITELADYMVTYYGSGEGRVSAGKEHLEVYRYLDDINPSQDDWRRLAAVARDIGIELCVMPNDFASLEFAHRELDPKYLVLTAASFVEPDFVKAVAATGRTTVFRAGGATLGEIESTVHLFQAHSQAEAILLHGFQNYPTKLEETNIHQLDVLRELFGTQVGLADHIDGGDPIAKSVPMLALAFGATAIEKHITWDRAEKGEDFEAALDPADFKTFVANVRAAEVALGSKVWAPMSETALRYRNITRKRLVAARDLAEGAVLEKADVMFKRSDYGANGEQIGLVLGRTLDKALEKDDGIALEDLR